MSTAQHHHFDQVWQVPRPLDEAWDVLADIDAYALWWPQVRSVERVAEDVCRVRIRSALPVPLNLTLTREVADRDRGLLAVALTGDLVGRAEWQLSWQGETTTAARWTQDVDVAHRWLATLPAAARGPLRLNHTLMMRSGEAGLRRYLAGRRPAAIPGG